MNAAERAYPVVLDPIVEADLRAKNIQDQTVAPGKNFNYLWGMVEAGYYAPYGVERFYMQYVDLPALTSADVVVQASISLYKLQKSSKSSQVNVHHVSGSWDSRTLQWSNRPDYDSRVQDYLMVRDTGWYTWDITDIAQKWYQTGNNGMLFKMPDSVENAAKEEWTQFCSADYSAAALPGAVYHLYQQLRSGELLGLYLGRRRFGGYGLYQSVHWQSRLGDGRSGLFRNENAGGNQARL